jgi:hypothetical protein
LGGRERAAVDHPNSTLLPLRQTGSSPAVNAGS